MEKPAARAAIKDNEETTAKPKDHWIVALLITALLVSIVAVIAIMLSITL